MHKIRKRNQLAIIRELWNARNEIAANEDISPGKLLNDGAIVELAMNPPANKREFDKVLRRVPSQCGLRKMRVGGQIAFLCMDRCRVDIREIAPATARNQDFLARPRCMVNHQHAPSALPCGQRTHQPSAASAQNKPRPPIKGMSHCTGSVAATIPSEPVMSIQEFARICAAGASQRR